MNKTSILAVRFEPGVLKKFIARCKSAKKKPADVVRELCVKFAETKPTKD